MAEGTGMGGDYMNSFRDPNKSYRYTETGYDNATNPAPKGPSKTKLLIIKIKSWFNKDIIFYKQNIKIKIYFNNYKIVQKFILNDW